MATTGSGPKTVLEYTADPNFTGGGKKWYQRAKTNKLLYRDNNTKYFHLVTNDKKQKKRIFQLSLNVEHYHPRDGAPTVISWRLSGQLKRVHPQPPFLHANHAICRAIPPKSPLFPIQDLGSSPVGAETTTPLREEQEEKMEACSCGRSTGIPSGYGSGRAATTGIYHERASRGYRVRPRSVFSSCARPLAPPTFLHAR
jgi:hypothetical protein